MSELNLEALLLSVANLVTAWVLKVLGALVVLWIGRMAARATRKVIVRVMERGKADTTLTPFIASLGYYLVLAFVVIAVLGMVGVQTASMVAVLGAAGLAIGLALQGTLSNFAAGVMLLAFRPFRVGEYIEAGGSAGTVQSIGLFATTLGAEDNVRIVIPNSVIYRGAIKNYAANGPSSLGRG